MGAWTEHEKQILAEFYGAIPFAKVRRMLSRRTAKAIMKQASNMGLSENTRTDIVPDTDESWPPPAQDLLQQLECVRFRKWRGPVTTGPLVPALGMPVVGMREAA